MASSVSYRLTFGTSRLLLPSKNMQADVENRNAHACKTSLQAHISALFAQIHMHANHCTNAWKQAQSAGLNVKSYRSKKDRTDKRTEAYRFGSVRSLIFGGPIHHYYFMVLIIVNSKIKRTGKAQCRMMYIILMNILNCSY